MRHRRLRPRACVVVALVAMATIPVELDAAPLPVFDPSVFSAAAEAVTLPLQQPGWTCSADGDTSCECVELAHDDTRVVLTGVDFDSDSLRADRIAVVAPDSWLLSKNFEARLIGESLTVEFGTGSWRSDSEPEFELTFDNGVATRDRDDSPRAELGQPLWRRADDDHRLVPSCDDILSAPVAGDGSPHAGADMLSSTDDGWTASNLSWTHAISPPVSSTIVADEALTGFFPPSVSVHSDGVRLTGSYHLAAPQLTARAHLDSEAVAGVGVGRWSTEPNCTADHCLATPLFLDLYASSDGLETLHVVGDIAAGEPERHVAASSDGLAGVFGDYNLGPAKRLMQNAFFRDWSIHRGAAGLSEPDHNLDVGTALIGDTAPPFDVTSATSYGTRLWMDYGTGIDLTDSSRADFHLHYAEFDPAADDSGRLARTSVGVERMYGSWDRAFVRPAARGDMIIEVLDTSAGPKSGSRAQFDALVEGGLFFRGHPRSMSHTISPRGFAGRRLFAEDALLGELHATATDHRALRRDSPFNFTGVSVDQQLDITDGHRLRLPVGAVLIDDGSAGNWHLDTRATMEYVADAPTRSVTAGIDTRCTDGCDEIGLEARVQVRWSERLESIHIAGFRPTLHPSFVPLDQQLRTGISRWRSPSAAGDEDDRLVHLSSFRARLGDWSAQVRMLGDLRTASASGAELSLNHFWPDLGWGAGIHLAASGDDSRWATTLGVTHSPAF